MDAKTKTNYSLKKLHEGKSSPVWMEINFQGEVMFFLLCG